MKVSVRNFQSLGQVSLDASGLTVVVGRSNLGKSALIRAMTGALFNRPGESFVRLGHTYAEVSLTDLPTTPGPRLAVEWTKGHNLNQFTVNGKDYKRVGQEAPPAIATAGYRDVFIGDKERGRGETLRPQVAGQFDPLFLLTTPGSFVNDVLSVVSRLGVLLNAHGRCAKDLRGVKQELGVREKDLAAADAKLAALRPIVELHARVEALQEALTQAKAAAALVAKVRALADARPALVAVCQQTLPSPVFTAVREIEKDHLKTVTGRDLLRNRGRLGWLAQRPLPGVTEIPDLAQQAAETLQRASPLVRLLQATAVTMRELQLAGDPTPELAHLTETCATNATQATMVRRLLSEQTAATSQVFKAVQTLNGLGDLETEAETALSTALDALDLCPICNRPLEKSAAAV